MIFVHTHEHKWEWTSTFVHGERVTRCLVCGDMAYGVPLQVIIGTAEWQALRDTPKSHDSEEADRG